MPVRCPRRLTLTIHQASQLKVVIVSLILCKNACKTILGKGSAVSSSLHVKVKDPKQFVTPSPGAYNPQNANKVRSINQNCINQYLALTLV